MSLAIFSAITSTVKGVGGLLNYRDSKKAAKETTALAKKNAQLQRAENAEVERRQDRTDKQLKGEATARRYASGYSSVDVGGAGDMYLSAVDAEQTAQMDWLKKSGESKALLIEEQGALQAKNIERQGQGQLLSAFGDFATAGFYASEGGVFRGDTPPPNVTNTSYGTGGKKLTVPANATSYDWSTTA